MAKNHIGMNVGMLAFQKYRIRSKDDERGEKGELSTEGRLIS